MIAPSDTSNFFWDFNIPRGLTQGEISEISNLLDIVKNLFAFRLP